MTGWWSTAAGAVVIVAALAVVTAAAKTQEQVTVQKVTADQAVVIRPNGAAYLIKKGAGCPSLRRYQGHQVALSAPALFMGAGSKLVISDLDQQCRVYSSTRIDSGGTE